MTHLSKSGMLPLSLNVISSPVTNQDYLSIPVFKGLRAAHAGVVFGDDAAAAPNKIPGLILTPV